MDDLVQSVTCYNPRPIIFHGYLAPFFILHSAVYYYFSQTHTEANTTTTPTHNSGLQVDDSSDTTNLIDSSIQSLDKEAAKRSYEIWVIAVTLTIAAQAITYLFCHWSVDVKCWLSYSECNDPYRAQYVKVTPTPNNGSTELVLLRRDNSDKGKAPTLWFEFQKTKYVLDEKSNKFSTIEFPCDQTLAYYKQWKGYQEQSDLHLVEKQYGVNQLEMVIPEFKELFIERATAPFFLFQTFCVGLWCLDEFWYYALFTLFMLVTFEVVLVKHQLRNMQEIRRMGNQPFLLQVYRQNKWKQIRSDQLVAGDLVSIVRSEHSIPCDILLLRGSCIIDESTLTGESVPQMKESIEELTDGERPLDFSQDKLHILFGGTKVLQHTAPNKEPGCVGYVLRTGFHTSQGKLLRTILFGVKRVTANNFETFCFIMFLLFFAMLSAYYVWTKGIEDPKRSRYRLFFECTVIITSVVPPELPIELSLAVNSSLLSLSKLFIYCTEPFRIPFAGKVEYLCFDKTGTLTSDDLIVEGVAGLPQDLDEDVKKYVTTETTDKNSSRSQVVESSLAKHRMVTPVTECPISTQQVLASCHSLTHLDEKLVGDPLERKVLEALQWNYSKSGTVTPKKSRSPPLKIHHRFNFNSTLKRMSVVASYRMEMTNDNVYICTSKGAPEFMRPLMKNVPDNYDQVYLEMSRQGARVLALGYKTLGPLSHQELSELKREDAEKDLMFAGFILITCPLKPDSKAVCTELAESSHRLVMITGDGALTACHVASVLNFVKDRVLILTNTGKAKTNPDHWTWISTDQEKKKPFEMKQLHLFELARKYSLCLTGDSLDFVLNEVKFPFAQDIIFRVSVFARVSPKQKEMIITTLKSRRNVVLMCGDGTNDVGALKHAHVGVALLSSTPNTTKPPANKPSNQLGPSGPSQQKAIEENAANKAQNQAQQQSQLNKRVIKSGASGSKKPINPSIPTDRPMTAEERKREKILEARAKLNELLEEQDRAQFVKLGDASIAAPFTSRLSSIECISHIIKQGRCTLVTTLQMFKILALNALLSAYCHSVLYLDGIKFSDSQITIQGLLSTFCFLFITRSQPLKKLSSQRPLPNIFNFYTIVTVTLQFAIHFASLVFLYSQARTFQQVLDERNSTDSSGLLKDQVEVTTLSSTDVANSSSTSSDDTSEESLLHTEFKASLVNSTVYIIWMYVQLATFVVNYKGHPFMQDLRSNRPLCYSFVGSAVVIFACVNGWSPSLTQQLSIVDFPLDFRPIVLGTIVTNFFLSYGIDRYCEYLFGRVTLKPL